jgi:hypothetical protein
MDPDLEALGLDQLRAEVMLLRSGIRYHRDQRGHERCWLNDIELYSLLPELAEAEFLLPDQGAFLEQCALYWVNRQPPPKDAP